MRLLRNAVRIVPACLAGLVAACGTSGLQPPKQYEWAILDAAAIAAPVVRITVIDGRSGAADTRCVFSAELIDALMIEQRLPRSQQGYRWATGIALQSAEHSFSFARPESLAQLDPDTPAASAELARACALIQRGRSALWSQREARVVAGPSFTG